MKTKQIKNEFCKPGKTSEKAVHQGFYTNITRTGLKSKPGWLI